MNFLSGKYVDLTDYRIGSFVIDRLVGRNANGEPRWEIRCTVCGHWQIMEHPRVAALASGRHTQISLVCDHPACASRVRRQSETLADVLKRERRQEAEKAKAEAEAQSRAQAEAVKRQGETARVEALKSEWREVYLYQLCTDLPEDEICTFEQWISLPLSSRQAVLTEVRQNPRSLIAEYLQKD